MTIRLRICYIVNYVATQPGNKVYYVEPASSAFDAQSAEIKGYKCRWQHLESVHYHLKFVAESADARRLDRVNQYARNGIYGT